MPDSAGDETSSTTREKRSSAEVTAYSSTPGAAPGVAWIVRSTPDSNELSPGTCMPTSRVTEHERRQRFDPDPPRESREAEQRCRGVDADRDRTGQAVERVDVVDLGFRRRRATRCEPGAARARSPSSTSISAATHTSIPTRIAMCRSAVSSIVVVIGSPMPTECRNVQRTCCGARSVSTASASSAPSSRCMPCTARRPNGSRRAAIGSTWIGLRSPLSATNASCAASSTTQARAIVDDARDRCSDDVRIDRVGRRCRSA